MEQEIAKYEGSSPEGDDGGEGEPLPVISKVRGPRNRLPRHRSVYNFWELRQLKAKWLRGYTACASIETSCQFVGRDVRSFYRWLAADPQFKAAYLEIKRQWETVRGEVVVDRLVALDIKATEVVAAALESKDEELKTTTALKLLKAHGRLVDKQVVEHEGEVKHVHTVEVLQPKEE